jgi:hypothetical protein
MEIELLRYLNGTFMIAGPVLLIGPLIRKGHLLWLWLPLIFAACFASHFYVYQTTFPRESALLRATVMSVTMMVFGWAMAVTMRRYLASDAARASRPTARSHIARENE